MFKHGRASDSFSRTCGTSKLTRALLFGAAIASAKFVGHVRADQTATWNGTTGNWSDFTKWSTNPNFPNNGTPAGTLYDAIINSGTERSPSISARKSSSSRSPEAASPVPATSPF